MLTKHSCVAVACAGTTGSIALAIGTNSPLAYVPAVAIVGVLALAASVLLPALWSRKATRRRAALDVLGVLLSRTDYREARGQRRRRYVHLLAGGEMYLVSGIPCGDRERDQR